MSYSNLHGTGPCLISLDSVVISGKLCQGIIPTLLGPDMLPKRVIIVRNRTEHSENTEQLCKSSLQCLISMSCISLVPLLLGSLCLERTGCAKTRAEACVRLTLAVTLTLKFQPYEYQHVGLDELYPVICSSWRSDTAVRTYIAVLCFPSVPFCSVK